MERRPIAATIKTPAQNFTGDVYLIPIFNGDGTSRLVVGLVRFTPGARTNWHSHANGQLLQCTDGVGLVVSRDGTVIRLRADETVWTPAGEEHWHGGSAETHDVPLRDPRPNPRRRRHHLARTSHRPAVRRRQHRANAAA